MKASLCSMISLGLIIAPPISNDDSGLSYPGEYSEIGTYLIAYVQTISSQALGTHPEYGIDFLICFSMF